MYAHTTEVDPLSQQKLYFIMHVWFKLIIIAFCENCPSRVPIQRSTCQKRWRNYNEIHAEKYDVIQQKASKHKKSLPAITAISYVTLRASLMARCLMIGMRDVVSFFFIITTRNELASLAHSFYTCLKHQLMHQLYSSALPWIMLHAWCWILSCNYFLGQIAARGAAGCICHVHILADHVTLSIG